MLHKEAPLNEGQKGMQPLQKDAVLQGLQLNSKSSSRVWNEEVGLRQLLQMEGVRGLQRLLKAHLLVLDGSWTTTQRNG